MNVSPAAAEGPGGGGDTEIRGQDAPPGDRRTLMEGGGVVSRIRSLSPKHEYQDESGQALVEYALILMLVALLTIGALTTIGTTVSSFLTSMASGFGGG